MLRLIALALLVLTTAVEAQVPEYSEYWPPPKPYEWRPDTLRTSPLTPTDVGVSPEEHALRDLMPGWVPCRPLSENEMAFGDSPHQMRSGGFYFAGNARGAPVIPADWTAGWSEPGPLIATAVPRGWWWRPENSKWWGAWIVLGKGDRKGHRFYSLVTTPLRAVDYGSVAMIPAIRTLYDALRDQVATRRTLDPATLDAESERLAHGGHAAPPSVIQQATARAKALDRQDKLEDAADLLEITLDDGVGTPPERLRGLFHLAYLKSLTGEYDAANSVYTDARRIARQLENEKMRVAIDTQLQHVAEAKAAGPYMGAYLRATFSFDRENWPGVVERMRAVLPQLGDNQYEYMSAHWRLAIALRHTGDAAAARTHADEALKLADRLDEPEIAAKMKRLLGALGPAASTP